MSFFEKLDGDIMLELGSRIKQLRSAHKLSQQNLADRIGTSRKLIVDIEAGRGTSLLVFVKILKVFGKTEKLLELLKTSTLSPKEIFLKEHK